MHHEVQAYIHVVDNYVQNSAVRGVATINSNNQLRNEAVEAVIELRNPCDARTLWAALCQVLAPRDHARRVCVWPLSDHSFDDAVSYLCVDGQPQVSHPEAERQRARCRWRRVGRTACLVGRFVSVLHAMFAEVHYRPGSVGAQVCRERFEACVALLPTDARKDGHTP